MQTNLDALKGHIVEFNVGNGVGRGYLSVPKTSRGGVIVLHAWWGLNDFFKSLCDRLAAEGYTAFAPDLREGKVARTIFQPRLGKMPGYLDLVSRGFEKQKDLVIIPLYATSMGLLSVAFGLIPWLDKVRGADKISEKATQLNQELTEWRLSLPNYFLKTLLSGRLPAVLALSGVSTFLGVLVALWDTADPIWLSLGFDLYFSMFAFVITWFM